MSKTGRPNYRRIERESSVRPKGERHISLRTVRRDPPDVDLLSKAFLALALADAARMAEEAATVEAETATNSGVSTISGQDPSAPQADTTAPEHDSTGKGVDHDN